LNYLQNFEFDMVSIKDEDDRKMKRVKIGVIKGFGGPVGRTTPPKPLKFRRRPQILGKSIDFVKALKALPIFICLSYEYARILHICAFWLLKITAG
jgi:hypothetical protein